MEKKILFIVEILSHDCNIFNLFLVGWSWEILSSLQMTIQDRDQAYRASLCQEVFIAERSRENTKKQNKTRKTEERSIYRLLEVVGTS